MSQVNFVLAQKFIWRMQTLGDYTQCLSSNVQHEMKVRIRQEAGLIRWQNRGCND